MTLKTDNKGVAGLINSWGVGRRTCHIDICYLYLCKAKAENMVIVEWISSKNNPSDLLTKNLNNELFKKHSEVFCGESRVKDKI
jgi:hypothetical protein